MTIDTIPASKIVELRVYRSPRALITLLRGKDFYARAVNHEIVESGGSMTEDVVRRHFADMCVVEEKWGGKLL